MTKIDRVEIIPFSYEIKDVGVPGHGATGVGNVQYEKDGKATIARYAVRIRTDDGLEGAYVTHWVGTQASLGQSLMLAPHLLGRDPEEREVIYDDLKRELRAYDHMGHGPIDIALWDLAGRKYGTPIAKLLGGYRWRLPTYASSYHGQESGGGLDSPAAFADFAAYCKDELGYAGFKIHGWLNGDVAREIENIQAVRKRVGDDFRLMLDPACQLRTFMDALEVGRACDDAGFFWYEDPYRDASVSAFAHARLREKLKTPLLITEHVRGLEQKGSFLVAGGCDMVHADPEYDMGITGAMKIAHLCEAMGLDVQLHASGPAHRHCIAAIRNTHMYEQALVGPGMPNAMPPVYACGYSDLLEDIGADGCFPVPTGPGLGVTYDWERIEQSRLAEHVFA